MPRTACAHTCCLPAPVPLESIADLIRKNPSAATAGPGTALSDLPCYSAGNDININYYGGDVAFGMVSRSCSASVRLAAGQPETLGTAAAIAAAMQGADGRC